MDKLMKDLYVCLSDKYITKLVFVETDFGIKRKIKKTAAFL